jgi:hypothetical protein
VFVEVSGSRIESDYRRRPWVWPCAPSPSPRCTWPTPTPPPWSSVQFAARSSAGLLSASVAARRTRVSREEDPSFVAAIQRRRLPHTWAWQIHCFFVEVQLHGNMYALFLWPPSDRYPTKHYYYSICTYILFSRPRRSTTSCQLEVYLRHCCRTFTLLLDLSARVPSKKKSIKEKSSN